MEAESGPGEALLTLYDRALPQVYGYLLRRCGGPDLAQELTAETFLAAVTSIQKGVVQEVTVAWLVGIARHKLADHWRKASRDERDLVAVAAQTESTVDPWEAQLDALRADATLCGLAPQHRAALTLRYLDDLPVPTVADILGRTVHATEALLVRARAAFRVAYEGSAA